MSLKNPVNRYVIYNEDGTVKDYMIGTKNSKVIKKAKKFNIKYDILKEFNEEQLSSIIKDEDFIQFFIDLIAVNNLGYNKNELNIMLNIKNLTIDDIINSEEFKPLSEYSYNIVMSITNNQWKNFKNIDESIEFFKNTFIKAFDSIL